MTVKPIKLSKKRNGTTGEVTSFSINLGSSEVKSCGFLADAGNARPLEKVILPKEGCIIIRLAKDKE